MRSLQNLERIIGKTQKHTYPCPFCASSFSYEQLCASHLSAAHAAGNPYLCHKCPSAHCKRSKLERHYRLAHYDSLARVRSCARCGLQTDSEAVMTRHRLHDHEFGGRCGECGFVGGESTAGSVHALHCHEGVPGCLACGERWIQAAEHVCHECRVLVAERVNRVAVSTEKKKQLTEVEAMKVAEKLRAEQAAREVKDIVKRVDSPVLQEPLPASTGFSKQHNDFLAMQLAAWKGLPQGGQVAMATPEKRRKHASKAARGSYEGAVGDDNLEDFGNLGR